MHFHSSCLYCTSRKERSTRGIEHGIVQNEIHQLKNKFNHKATYMKLNSRSKNGLSCSVDKISAQCLLAAHPEAKSGGALSNRASGFMVKFHCCISQMEMLQRLVRAKLNHLLPICLKRCIFFFYPDCSSPLFPSTDRSETKHTGHLY